MNPQEPSKLNLFAFDFPEMEELEAQYNPEELDFAFNPSYDHVDILGSTNKPVHYTGTDNPTVPINLRFWATTRDEMARLYIARTFLMRLVYPVALEGVTSAPTRILLTLPNITSVIGIATNLRIKHVYWAASGKIRHFSATFDFEILPGREMTAGFIDTAGFMWASGSNVTSNAVIEEV
jgi:hypothetical protein